MDLIKSIIKWIIIVFLIVFLIYLISRLGTSSEKKNTTKKNLKPVTTVKEKTDRAIDSLVPDPEYNNNNNNNNNNNDNTQVVAVQDTASSGEIAFIIGSFIISIGTFYIYKHEN